MNSNLILGCGVAVIAIVAGCGSSTGSGGAGGTGSTVASATSTTKAATSTTKGVTATATTGTGPGSGGAGGASGFLEPVCSGIPASPPSNGSCYTVPPPGTTTATTTSSTGTSMDGSVPCNPVKDTQCDVAAMAACDTGTDAYDCYAAPNTGTLCGACGNGVFCGDGLTCIASDNNGGTKCARYCCTDADCGGTAGSCVIGIANDPNVGLCGTVMP